MNQLRYAFAFFVFISIALPAKSELWGCNNSWGESHPHPIELVSNIEDGTGKIKIQGLPEIPTRFIIRGLDRVWGWFDDLDNNEAYAFVIRTDDSGHYLAGSPEDHTYETYHCHKH